MYKNWAVKALAIVVTLTALSMAAVAAWERGGSTAERCLIVTLSITISLSAHFLPALSKNRLAWFLWFGCLIATVYGHLVFFSHASVHAGEIRAQSTAQVVGVSRQIESIQDALAEIKARPVATVAAELSVVNGSRLRSALRVELIESKRSAALRDELIRLSGIKTTAEVVGATDPVTALLASLMRSSESNTSLVIGIGFSILLELVGALLWYEVLRYPLRPDGITPDYNILSDVSDPIASLKKAISDGKCRATVSSIREFRGCGQAKAMELRRAL